MNKFLTRRPLQAPADAGQGAAPATPPATPPAAAGGAAAPAADAGKNAPTAPTGGAGAKDGAASANTEESILGSAGEAPKQDEKQTQQQGTEAQDGQGTQDGEKKDGDKPADDAPFEVTLPDGVEVDKETLDAFVPTFKELGITPEQASKLAEQHVGLMQKAQEAADNAWKQQQAKWADELKQAWGSDHAKQTQLARNAVVKFGGAELAQQLGAMGLGNHPGLARAFAAIGAAMADDTSGTDPTATGSTELSESARLAAFYDDPKPQNP